MHDKGGFGEDVDRKKMSRASAALVQALIAVPTNELFWIKGPLAGGPARRAKAFAAAANRKPRGSKKKAEEEEKKRSRPEEQPDEESNKKARSVPASDEE